VSAPALDRSRPPPPRPLRPFHFPRVRRTSLPNGLEVIVAESRALPVATVDLVLPCGGLAEPDDRGGLAALTAGLLESGGGGRDAAAVAEAVDALGLSLEVGVTWDSTLAGFTALSSRLGEGMEILAALVVHPEFPEREVERIRDERLAALAQRRADPASAADELAAHFTFAPGHPFGRRLGGLRSTLATLTRGDVAGFHAARYRPLGAAVCAAGDVTLEEVAELAERHLGAWEGGPEPGRAPSSAARFDRTTLVLADRPGAVQSELRVGHLGIARTDRDFYPVTVMNSILGGLFSSRLNLNLRERLGYTYGASSSFAARRLPGSFTASAAVQVEGTAHAVAEVLRDMRRMQEEPVPAAELEDALAYLAGVFPLSLETTDALASRLAALAVYGLEDDHWDHHRDRILAVTAAEVQAAARERLFPDRAAVVVVGDAARLRGELEALDAGPVEVVSEAEVLR
jgi:zinc protease